MKKTTLILGASINPERYSYKALQLLISKQHPVLAVGKSGGEVNGITISKEPIFSKDIQTVTLYLNPTHQKAYYEYILALQPARIIFNPGTENQELEKLAEANDIQCIRACTLVLLSTGQY